MAIVQSIREAYAFGPKQQQLASAANTCLQMERDINGFADALTISKSTFVAWCLAEPRSIVWIPTMHRIAASENAKHETVCCVCKTYPIVGFRFDTLHHITAINDFPSYTYISLP
eukprot:m.241876 g.241876  ORF g.241876 m.241876 type:complete len:115 (-) comp15328_c1_seq10:65-409(-)